MALNLGLSLIEALALFLLVPLVSLLSGEPIEGASAKLLDVVGLADVDATIQTVIVAAAAAALFIFRSLVSIGATWWSVSLANQIEVSLVDRLLVGYADEPIERQAERNSAVILRAVTTSIPQVAGLANGFLNAVGDVILLIVVAVVIVVASPVVGLAVIAYVSVLGAVWTLVVSTALTRAGHRTQEFAESQVKYVAQGASVAKELQLRGRPRFYASQASSATSNKVAAARLETVVVSAQRYIFDALLIVGIAAVAGVIVATGQGDDILALLALIAAASFRVMPSISRLLTFANSVQYGVAPVSLVTTELASVEGVAPVPDERLLPPAERDTPLLEINDVSFSYATRPSPALEGVTIRIAEGESVGIVGATGSGKSTLLNVVLGLLEPDSGTTLARGEVLQKVRIQWQHLIGYVPQDTVLVDDTIRANVALGWAPHEIDDERISTAIHHAALDEFIESLPEGLETEVGERGVRLSGGQRQRIGLARALYMRPDVLILDEATSNLDMRTEDSIMSSIDALHGELAIVMVAHRIETVKKCDRIVFLASGRVEGEGPFAHLVEESATFREFVASSSHDPSRPEGGE